MCDPVGPSEKFPSNDFDSDYQNGYDLTIKVGKIAYYVFGSLAMVSIVGAAAVYASVPLVLVMNVSYSSLLGTACIAGVMTLVVKIQNYHLERGWTGPENTLSKRISLQPPIPNQNRLPQKIFSEELTFENYEQFETRCVQNKQQILENFQTISSVREDPPVPIELLMNNCWAINGTIPYILCSSNLLGAIAEKIHNEDTQNRFLPLAYLLNLYKSAQKRQEEGIFIDGQYGILFRQWLYGNSRNSMEDPREAIGKLWQEIGTYPLNESTRKIFSTQDHEPAFLPLNVTIFQEQGVFTIEPAEQPSFGQLGPYISNASKTFNLREVVGALLCENNEKEPPIPVQQQGPYPVQRTLHQFSEMLQEFTITFEIRNISIDFPLALSLNEFTRNADPIISGWQFFKDPERRYYLDYIILYDGNGSTGHYTCWKLNQKGQAYYLNNHGDYEPVDISGYSNIRMQKPVLAHYSLIESEEI
ncbi:MAG: hypothetical protein JW769_01720 [Parachlamydiales bacterium]|nr:hypothetical protein [Parachlamydiales bacterium]